MSLRSKPSDVAASDATVTTAADAGLPWIVADVGGINARLAWVLSPERGVEHLQSLAVADHAGPLEAIQAYMHATRSLVPDPPRRAALAMAASPSGDEVSFTNSAWSFSRAGLQRALGLDALLLLNDFEALALSLPRLGAHQLRSVGPLLPDARGTLAALGPGTGLGVAGVTSTPGGWVALPAEGGHVTLAAADDFEAALLQHTRRTHVHVSAERYLSGIGLPVLYDAVAAVTGAGAMAGIDTRTIIESGLAASGDVTCSRTLDVFCAMLGGLAGNVALTLGARGGVYIGGGLVPRLGARFDGSAFRARFEAKGRFSTYLAPIPTLVITDTLSALTGAMVALEQHRSAASTIR